MKSAFDSAGRPAQPPYGRLGPRRDVEEPIAVLEPAGLGKQPVLGGRVIPGRHRALLRLRAEVEPERDHERPLVETRSQERVSQEARRGEPGSVHHHAHEVRAGALDPEVDGGGGRGRGAVDAKPSGLGAPGGDDRLERRSDPLSTTTSS